VSKMELVNYWQIATCISLVVAYFSTKEVVFSCNRTIKILDRQIELLTALRKVEGYMQERDDGGQTAYITLPEIRKIMRDVFEAKEGK